MRHVRDDGPVVVVERSSGGLGAFFFGLALGAGMALMLAPQSGEETREALRGRGRRLRELAEEKVDEFQDRLEEGYSKTRERVEKGFDSARDTVRTKREGARDALKAGKAAVHSAREELDRRLAEVRATRGDGDGEEDDAGA